MLFLRFKVWLCEQTAKLIKSGSLKLLLWEGYWGCEGFPRCTAQEQFAIEYAVAYQPLQFSVVGMPACRIWSSWTPPCTLCVHIVACACCWSAWL